MIPSRRTQRAFPALIAATLILALTACVVDAGTAAPGGTISGTVYYRGPVVAPGRPLAIAVYRTFPPAGPPVAARLVETYQFPYAYQFDGLAPGTYHVGALIDVDRLDTRYAGMLNAARDPHAYAAGPALVDQLEGAAFVDVDLEDPQ